MSNTTKDNKTIPSLVEQRVDQTPDAAAHFVWKGSEGWQGISWNEFYQTSARYAAWLKNIGLQKGYRVGVMVNTSHLWEVIQLAILMNGAVVVGIDPSDSKENINFIVQRGNLDSIFVNSASDLTKIEDNIIGGLTFIVSLSDRPDTRKVHQWPDDIEPFKPIGDQSLPDDPATIIFTSGTTGQPKGVLYTHAQIRIACDAILSGFDDIAQKTNIACWLPLSNLFQRIINFCAVQVGANIYFVENPKKIVQLLPTINPQFFIGVPRVFEKIYMAIEAQVEKKNWIQRRLIQFAFKYGDKQASALRERRTLSFVDYWPYLLSDKLVLAKIRSLFGADIKYFISGSAPMPKWLLKRFHAMGILVLEAYGISENVIPNAMNTPSDYAFGTVGKPLPLNKIKFSEDSELSIKGPGVFEGYLGETKEKAGFTGDGFFPTGDFAKLDQRGNLVITGRKSDVFKTSTGRKIPPVVIESRLSTLPYVEQAIVFGKQKKNIMAVILIQKDYIRDNFLCNGQISGQQFLETPNLTVLEKIGKDLFEQLVELPGYLKPSGFYLTGYQLSIARNELTSNLKLRRHKIEEGFEPSIESVYKVIEQRNIENKSKLYSYVINGFKKHNTNG